MVAVKDVAIIGAGPSGLSAARYLLSEKVFNVRIFEQKPVVGGVWAYNKLTITDDNFSIPRTQPTMKADDPIASAALQFITPVYDSLETNIPYTLMNFIDRPFPVGTSLFPRHTVIKKYLDTYAEELQPFISLSSQILQATKSSDERGGWILRVLDLTTKIATTTRVDILVIASGHYNDPFVPDIPGLSQFNAAHPMAISHSKFYKNPESFKNKKVIVVGNSASGLDISDQISKVCQLPVIVSEKSGVSTPSRPAIAYKPEIVEFIPEGRKVRFANGDVEAGVEHVVFCTGYFYSFHFLRDLSPPPVSDGFSVHHLYQHMLYRPDPTLAFLGIPQRVVPFPFVEAQAAYLARIWAGRLALPTEAELMDWELILAQAQQEGQGNIHVLKFPKDLEYINMLHAKSITAEKRDGLECEGMGRPPPYWDEEKAWIRARMAQIKSASRQLGDSRHLVTDLRQLGFDYGAENEKQQEDEKQGMGLGDVRLQDHAEGVEVK